MTKFKVYHSVSNTLHVHTYTSQLTHLMNHVYSCFSDGLCAIHLPTYPLYNNLSQRKPLEIASHTTLFGEINTLNNAYNLCVGFCCPLRLESPHRLVTMCGTEPIPPTSLPGLPCVNLTLAIQGNVQSGVHLTQQSISISSMLHHESLLYNQVELVVEIK